MTVEKFQVGDLPNDLLEQAARAIEHYATAFIFGEHVASGTFVRINGRPGILTARHVWLAVQRFARAGGDVLLVVARGPHRFVLDVSTVTPRVNLDSEEDKWGPDIEFLEMPPALVSMISARKSFAELTPKYREVAVSDFGFGVVGGFPQEYLETEPEGHGDILRRIRGGFTTSIERVFKRGNYDYVETEADYVHAVGLPSSFGGASGAGLWRVVLSKIAGAPTASATIKDFALLGVEFYEWSDRKERMVLRAHGPETLYDLLPQLVK